MLAAPATPAPPSSTPLNRTPRVIVLAGNPNSGKSTIFNALTGLRQKVANYPGVTVEKKTGQFRGLHGEAMEAVDLPGSYSLDSRSPDEAIAADILTGKRKDHEAIHAVVSVVDASNLERNLYLTLQLIEQGLPVVVALNMMDVVEAQGARLDAEALSRHLGVPVIPMAASKGRGFVELKTALSRAVPASRRPSSAGGRESAGTIEARYRKIREICDRVILRPADQGGTLTERIDSVVTHRVWGWVVFLAVISLVFYSIFAIASWPMDMIEAGTSAAGFWLSGHLPDGLLRSLLVDGVVAGVGGVIVFLPQILILFFFLGILEDTGYMARAAFIMDRVMAKVGLHGKSFIPLLSSFACAIPGIMAARTVDNPKDRLATILVAPLMSCSARLPVYALMIALLLPQGEASAWERAGVMLGMYLLGTTAAFLLAWLFKKTLLRGGSSMLVLELPPYRMPSLWTIVLRMWERARVFLSQAGTVILALSIVLWALVSFPRSSDPDALPSEALAHSAAGWVGRAIEPAIAPLGYDWKIGIGLIASFAAREVFVGTMAIVYNVGDDDGGGETLREILSSQQRPDGQPVYTPLVCLSLMIFYVFAMQCMSTLAVVRRETNSWRWPIFQFLYMTTLAYGLCFLVYQGGLLLGYR